MSYYNRKGQPITRDEWARLFDDREYVHVARMPVRGVEVCTVWLGRDHNFDDSGPSIIFETMLFPDEIECRYVTEEAAIAGHAAIVAALEAGADPRTAINCGWKVAEADVAKAMGDTDLSRFSELVLDRN